MTANTSDPMEFLKTLWSSTGMPLPGLVTPTLDTDELDKRVTDLKAVEGWLKTNLNMLQMTIQGLEVQRATLAAMQAISQSAGSADANANPFANPALWPWNFMQGQKPGEPAEDTAGAEKNDKGTARAKPKSRDEKK